MNYENLTNEELIELYQKEKHLEGVMDTAQMTEKILINSLDIWALVK